MWQLMCDKYGAPARDTIAQFFDLSLLPPITQIKPMPPPPYLRPPPSPPAATGGANTAPLLPKPNLGLLPVSPQSSSGTGEQDPLDCSGWSWWAKLLGVVLLVAVVAGVVELFIQDPLGRCTSDVAALMTATTSWVCLLHHSVSISLYQPPTPTRDRISVLQHPNTAV
jgi:hypothetical protein